MMGSEHVWTFRSRFAWQVKGSLHFVINEEKKRSCSISGHDRGRKTFEEDLERCISRGRRNGRDMFIRDVTRSGR